MKALFNLPKNNFLAKYALSNQRPHSISEFKHTKIEGAVYLNINDDGLCACKM